MEHEIHWTAAITKGRPRLGNVATAIFAAVFNFCKAGAAASVRSGLHADATPHGHGAVSRRSRDYEGAVRQHGRLTARRRN